MKHIITPFVFLLLHFAAFSQLEISWQQSFGGSDFEVPSVIKALPSGGLILAATSFSADHHVAGNHGADDILLVKLNAARQVEWRKVMGGSNEDGVHDLQITSDGGFILCGFTKSNDGDVNGVRGDCDFWVVKLNASGAILWEQTYGGSNKDVASSIKQAADGSYIVAGYTTSNDGQVTNNHGGGSQDAWVLKLDANGGIQWQRCYGGANAEFAYNIELAGNGYVFTGYARSADGDLSVNKGMQDGWIVKLDADGKIEWQQVLGGTKNEAGTKISYIPGEGYILAGNTASLDKDITGNHGAVDAWLVKLSLAGTVQWKKCYGGSSLESFRDIIPVTNGYWTIGSAESTDHDVAANYGSSDYWILQLDKQGNIVSQVHAGGTGVDDAHTACIDLNGELVVAGTSFSKDTDVKQWMDAGDVWVASFKETILLPGIITQPKNDTVCEGSIASFTIEAGHATAFQWQGLLGAAWMNLVDDAVYSGTQTPFLQLKTAGPLNGFKLRCVISNAAGLTISGVANLSILFKPEIQSQPQSSIACAGSTITLTVTSTHITNYSWQENINGNHWQYINGARQSSWVFMAGNVSRQFRCIANNGCGNDTSQTAVINTQNCSIKNAFSPNGDGVNDRWQVPILVNYPGCTVSVFDRNGKRVFYSRGYTNPWDGKMGGKDLPAGVYYYLIDLKDGHKPMNGTLNLLR